MSSPLVTVIIAAYNSEKFIKWTLQSVQQQTLKDFEVLVIGDGCTDQTKDVVHSFNDPRFHWKNLAHTLRSNATNQGIQDAKGKYIAYLDHDDLWFPWHLADLIACLEQHEADFVFSWDLAIHPQNHHYVLPPPFSHEHPRGQHSTPSAWLHRKDLVETCGFWRADIQNLRRSPDTEFLLQIKRQKKKMQFCRSLSVLYFPSPLWSFHQLQDHFPQERFAERLRADPEKLQREILFDLAFHYASKTPLPKKWPRWLVKLTELYGQDRFPIFQILRWRFLRQRKKWLANRSTL